ncbi:hypothetical protein R1sor_005856 [Riccia sorocarpa]|uniref:Uncharacterized protein n=1 Tax=Riccia sorocarpa TaxID=122646 RepID=A0ABD3HKQ7_9MARC
MKSKLGEFRAVLESQATTISSLRTEIARKTEEMNFILDEKKKIQVVGEEALQASQLECSELASLIKEIDGSMVQITTALATRTLERDQASEARMSTGQELRKRYSNLLNRMENAERDVEQLKTLIIQLDITREELVGKLKVTTTKEQQAEKHITAMEAEVGRLRGEVENRTAEVSHTCSLLEVLSRERDHLQSELSDLEGRISLEDANRSRLESEEHRAAAEELAALKCEHQLLKIDAAQMSKDNAVLMEDVRNMTDKVNQFHLALSLREKELEDLCNLYQSVQQQLFHEQTTEEMRQKAEEQVKSLVDENERLLSDFKSLERQADFMTRSLNQQSGLLNDYENEKKALVSQLTAARVAIDDLEAKLSTSIMEMTTLEETHREVSELLHNNMQEVERLSATANMEQERVRSLEHLLASIRAEELKL